jgi:uncharacterized membrane protein YidH (DUF202 family)
MSIRNYTDHAANERTLLAWVRTSIAAVIGFGFLVQRLDVALAILLLLLRAGLVAYVHHAPSASA